MTALMQLQITTSKNLWLKRLRDANTSCADDLSVESRMLGLIAIRRD
jgi:hypothetical protein